MPNDAESMLEKVWELLEDQSDFEVKTTSWNGLKTVKDTIARGWMSKDAFVYDNAVSIIVSGNVYTHDRYKHKVELTGKAQSFCLRHLLPHDILQAIVEAKPEQLRYQNGVLFIDRGAQIRVTINGGFIESVSSSAEEMMCIGPNCYSPVPFTTTFTFTRIRPGTHALSSSDLTPFCDRGVLK